MYIIYICVCVIYTCIFVMTKGCMIHIHQYTKGMVCLCVPFIFQWFLTTSPDASRHPASAWSCLPKISTGIWASAISFAPLPWVHHKCWRIQVWKIMWSILERYSINMFPSNSIHHGVSSTLPCCSCFYLYLPFIFGNVLFRRGALVPWQKMKMKGTTCRPWLTELLGILFACTSPGWSETMRNLLKQTEINISKT